MELKTLLLEVKDGVAVVTLNRPPVNAQNAEMRAEIAQVFDALTDMDDVAAVVLTGAGKVFCAGADIRERSGMAQAVGAYGKHNRLVRECYYAIVECSKPVVAAVNGAALGAGFGLVMAADIWVAAEEAYVSMPEINVGLAGGVSFLQTYFSQSRARRMFYTGMQVPAQELYRLGLVEACLPAGRADALRDGHRAGDRLQEPGRRAAGQGGCPHDQDHAAARRLPLRAGQHRRPVQDRGLQGSPARLP
jgi:enoyl-CoA hydratase